MAPKPKHLIHPIHGYKIKPTENLKTIKRNERERNRVQNLNSGFEVLRQNIPAVAAMKKMSKIQILSHAVNYIQYLHQILESSPGIDYSIIKTEPTSHNYSHYPGQYYQYQHQQQAPLTPTTPVTPVSPVHYDSDTSGVFSDQSMVSPQWPHYHHHQQYHHFQQQHLVSSTSSDDEDEVIDAIADWQHHNSHN